MRRGLIQLRNHDGGFIMTHSIPEAFNHAERNPEFWEISWVDDGHSVRFVRFDIDGRAHWAFDPTHLLVDEQTL